MTDAAPIRTPDYDLIWNEVYGDLQDLGPTHRHMARLLARMVAPLQYRSVLDVGVGFGHNLGLLTEGRDLERLVGVDISERAIAHVRDRSDGEFHRLDIVSDSLPETFELVCCALLLEHLPDDEAALANIRKMSSRHLLISTIAGDFERYRPWEQQVGHVRNYHAGELEAKLERAGFEVVEQAEWGYPLYSPLLRILQNRVKASSEMSRASRLAARLLYPMFFLNSSRRGDLLLVLARVAGPRASRLPGTVA